jgi:rod shape determining protein RodA
MQPSTRIWRHFDVWLLAAVSILTIAGIAMIQSAIGGNENLAERVPRQAIYASAGLVIVLIIAAIDYRIWSALARPLYLGITAILAFIFLAGEVGFGAARWFNVGIVLIQPSEIAKIVVILILGDYLARHNNDPSGMRTIMGSLFLAGIPALLILIQPDLSTAITLLMIWSALVWVSGLKFRNLGVVLLILVVLMLIITPLLANYFMRDYPQGKDFLFLKNYQMQRIANFLFPNPEESFGASYNVEQALISIGSGGIFGQGYGHGSQVQLRFLKVRHTDFIFSAMSQEFGFIGAVIFLLVLMFIVFRCLRAARIARDTFGALICYGVAILILFQGAFNVGMNLNLLPVSGLPLPFFSYGGSSLLTSLLGIGLVESVILRHKLIEL